MMTLVFHVFARKDMIPVAVLGILKFTEKEVVDANGKLLMMVKVNTYVAELGMTMTEPEINALRRKTVKFYEARFGDGAVAVFCLKEQEEEV